jgi:hypothetical protein
MESTVVHSKDSYDTLLSWTTSASVSSPRLALSDRHCDLQINHKQDNPPGINVDIIDDV